MYWYKTHQITQYTTPLGTLDVACYYPYMHTYTGTITAKTSLEASAMLIRIATVPPISFSGGQYITLSIPTPQGMQDRPFSIASPARETPTIELLVKYVPGGIASEFFAQAPVGTSISLRGPQGVFTKKHTDTSAYFFATGTGIAPFRSMLPEFLASPNHAIELVYVTAPEITHFTHPDFFLLTNIPPQFIITRIDIPEKDQQSSQEHAISRIRSMELDSCRASYVCGNPAFVHETIDLLRKKGFLENRIYTDQFL